MCRSRHHCAGFLSRRVTMITGRSRVLLGVALSLIAVSAFAGEITLFQDQSFHGRRMTAQAAVPDLDRSAFNDTASSVIVHGGVWEVCTDAYFRGRCMQLQPGEYASLGGTFNDHISSAREVVAYAPAATVIPPPVATDTRVVLYERPHFGGRSVELRSTVRDLDRMAFNDRADAIVVYGGVWRLCANEGFRGECRDFGPGRYENLGSLRSRVRSAELVAVAAPTVQVAPPLVQVPAPTVQIAQPAGTAPRAILYEQPGFGGSSMAINQTDVPNLAGTGFNDRAGSVRVEEGNWVFCNDAYLRGECRTF